MCLFRIYLGHPAPTDSAEHVPAFMVSVDQDRLKAAILHRPQFQEILTPFEVDYNKLIEFYTR